MPHEFGTVFELLKRTRVHEKRIDRVVESKSVLIVGRLIRNGSIGAGLLRRTGAISECNLAR